jgi:hypothetical protein
VAPLYTTSRPGKPATSPNSNDRWHDAGDLSCGDNIMFHHDLFLFPMPKMLPAKPPDGHERQYQRQQHEKYPGLAFTHTVLQENKAHRKR